MPPFSNPEPSAAATSTTPTVSISQSDTTHPAATSATKNPLAGTATSSSKPTASSTPSTTQVQSPSTAQPTSLTVSLQIDSKTAGNVSVATTANQCDVLNDALAQGIISSLDMRYFSSLSSYGVYVINGQGDSNQVWWVYSVNGKSPPVGCSKLGVSSGEIINWQYTGK